MTDEIERLLDEQEDGEQTIWAFPEAVGGPAARRGRRSVQKRTDGRTAADKPEKAGWETEKQADGGTDAFKETLAGTGDRTREEKRWERPAPREGAEDGPWAGDAARRAAGFVRDTAEDGRRLPRIGWIAENRTRDAESAETLYQRLRQAGKTARYRVRPEAAAELRPAAPDAGRLSLDELDRTFQRDARRYDCGFELY